ncbi:MAG: universal stress protein [Haloarculaceae archaeon]
MFDDVLIPTDGSTETEQAVSHGLGLARTYDATVHALHVSDESELPAVPEAHVREQLRSTAETLGERATADVVERAEEFDIPTERELRRGTPHEEIIDYVEDRSIDLVVMGTHGQAGVAPDLGSTTLRVVRTADVPALTVRFREGVDVDVGSHYRVYDDILVATDGSDGALDAAEGGLDVAEMYGATVHALYVVDPTTYAYEDVEGSLVGLLKESGNAALEEIEAMGQDRGVEVVKPVRRGRPATEILDYTDNNDIDLLTLGVHGWTGEVHLGSTTERVIRTAAQPTLSVR